MNELQKSNGGNLLDKAVDTMKDPNVGTAGKIGAVAVVAVTTIAYVAHKAIDAMGKVR